MQTFLPFFDFSTTARVLDYRRLGKQRVEAKQIVRALTEPEYGWKNHPAVKMWSGYTDALKLYHNIIIEEWIRRGYNNNMPMFEIDEWPEMPWWIGLEEFHSSHRQTLLFKKPDWYEQFGWPEEPIYEYWWPTEHKEVKDGLQRIHELV